MHIVYKPVIILVEFYMNNIYKSIVYQLNSLRLGLVNDDSIYGKPTIFFTIETQKTNKQDIQKYLEYHKANTHNLIAIPYNFSGGEPGDDYDIYQYCENVLGIKFHVTEKINSDHIFFKHFGTPEKNLTNYFFDNKTRFQYKKETLDE